MLPVAKQKFSLEGIMVVNKPAGMTSHDVVSVVRRKLKMRRIGHAGTLDPLATGVLIILVGKATKLFHKFEAFDKAYRATLLLGTKTTTADIEGKVLEQKSFEHFTQGQVEEVFKEFLGEIDQVPPMVSAIKVNGKRLYKLARQGLEVKRQARRIRIDKLGLLDFQLPKVKFYLECSKGTYVRQLAEDIGAKLGCPACIVEIERTKVGPFGIEKAVTLEELNETHIQRWQG